MSKLEWTEEREYALFAIVGEIGVDDELEASDVAWLVENGYVLRVGASLVATAAGREAATRQADEWNAQNGGSK